MAQDKKRPETNAENEAQTEATSSDETLEASSLELETPANTKLAKAGKRSRKAIEEAEAEAAKEAAKGERNDEPKVKHAPQTPHIKIRGKKYRDAAQLVEAEKHYELAEAIELAQKTSPVKFDASVEIHLNLGVDPKQADQAVRGTVVLPAGTGKSLRIAVIAPSDKQAEAQTAGADVVGEDDLLAGIGEGKINFDVLIATPDEMPKLSKVARVLGPKGLMPNPKSGTVTPNVAGAVKDAKGGKVEFRLDKQAIVHQIVGKVSFKADDLTRNAVALVNAIMKAKPSAAKGTYVKAMTITTTMGPGIPLNVTKVLAEANAKK